MSYPNDEAEDRVIAWALDAEEADEAAMDRAALDEYRTVLAHLPFEEVAPPVALEQRVFEAALAARPAAATSIRRPASKRRATARWVTLGAAVTAAAAVIAFMFTTSGDSGGVGGRVELTRASGGSEIAEQPGAKNATLTREGVQGTVEVGKVALAPDGEGVLYELDLADATDPDEVVWVWLVANDKLVPIGEITDPTTETVSFKVTGDVRTVDGVAMSIESSVEQPDSPGPIVARANF